MRSPHCKTLFVIGICSIALVLLLQVATIARQAPWEDEIFLVSTGLSLARSQPPVMSVMAHFPQTDSPITFYGPVTFEASALLIRIFGLSLTIWRIVCLAGVMLSAFASSRLVRVAGGDAWGQLIAAACVTFEGSIYLEQPGRWDFVTVGLFLTGLLLLLQGVAADRKTLLRKALIAGVFIGFCLGSSPRPLTLIAAALGAALLVAFFFPNIRTNILMACAITFGSGVVVQGLLLLPWGLNPFSWYALVRRDTKRDFRNATPLTGPGSWSLGLDLHKTVYLVGLCLLAMAILAATATFKARSGDQRLPLKLFLNLFATVNILLLAVLVGRAFGQSAYWLPMSLIAAMSWFDWELLQQKRLEFPAAVLTGICLLVLLFQEVQQIVPIVLTWNRRDTPDITAFVKRSLPPGADVYGPISGYFYSVELAGDNYLYLYDQGRFVLPFLPANPDSRSHEPEALDAEICARPTYAIWWEMNDAHEPLLEFMPQLLADRLQPKIAELHQPRLALWKFSLLNRIGRIGGKYGFYDVAIYPLKSLRPCAKQ